jgi:pimeloyl-ACP methyl ester carboxylesterase
MQNLYLPELDAHLCYHDLPGEEPVCVYLHGLGSASSADFPHIARHRQLARYRALLIDLLGYGFSERPAAFSHTLAAHADITATARSARAAPVSCDWPQHGRLHRHRLGGRAS